MSRIPFVRLLALRGEGFLKLTRYRVVLQIEQYKSGLPY
jgi:hypothetical protein